MTVREYITQKYQSFGIQISDADILDMLLGTGISENDEITDETVINKVNFGFTKVIPQLLVRATSVSESGFSMSWNLDGMKAYYGILCRTYGIEDVLNDKPKISML